MWGDVYIHWYIDRDFAHLLNPRQTYEIIIELRPLPSSVLYILGKKQ